MLEQKVRQDQICIEANVRRIRATKSIGQTELVRRLQLLGVDTTCETLAKIERGAQHIRASQLQGLRNMPETAYGELLHP